MSNQLAVFPAQTVGTTAVSVSTTTVGNEGNFTPRASVSVQADPTNTGTVYIGNSLLSTTRYARALQPGDFFTISGSAINANKIFALGSIAGQIIHVSGS